MGGFVMKTLKIGLLMILLSGIAAIQASTAAAQGSASKDAPDLIVIKTSWRKVEPINPDQPSVQQPRIRSESASIQPEQ